VIRLFVVSTRWRTHVRLNRAIPEDFAFEEHAVSAIASFYLYHSLNIKQGWCNNTDSVLLELGEARLDTDQLDTTNHNDRCLEAFHYSSAVSGSCSIDSCPNGGHPSNAAFYVIMFHGIEPARIVPETVGDDIRLVISPLFQISAQWFIIGTYSLYHE